MPSVDGEAAPPAVVLVCELPRGFFEEFMKYHPAEAPPATKRIKTIAIAGVRDFFRATGGGRLALRSAAFAEGVAASADAAGVGGGRRNDGADEDSEGAEAGLLAPEAVCDEGCGVIGDWPGWTVFGESVGARLGIGLVSSAIVFDVAAADPALAVLCTRCD